MEKFYSTKELQTFLAEKGMIWDGEYLSDAEQDGRRYIDLGFVGQRNYPKAFYSMIDDNSQLSIFAEEKKGDVETFEELSSEWISYLVFNHLDKASDIMDELDQKVYDCQDEQWKNYYVELSKGLTALCDNIEMMNIESRENDYNLLSEKEI